MNGWVITLICVLMIWNESLARHTNIDTLGSLVDSKEVNRQERTTADNEPTREEVCQKIVQFLEAILNDPILQLSDEQLNQLLMRKTRRMSRGLREYSGRCAPDVKKFIQKADSFMDSIVLSPEQWMIIVRKYAPIVDELLALVEQTENQRTAH